MTKLNLASVLAMQGAAKKARAQVEQDPATWGVTPRTAIELHILEDLLEDLVDFHAGFNKPPKKSKKK